MTFSIFCIRQPTSIRNMSALRWLGGGAPKENFKVFLLAGGAGRGGAGFFSAGRGGVGEFFWPNFHLCVSYNTVVTYNDVTHLKSNYLKRHEKNSKKPCRARPMGAGAWVRNQILVRIMLKMLDRLDIWFGPGRPVGPWPARPTLCVDC